MPSSFTALPNVNWQVGAQQSLTAVTAKQVKTSSPTIPAKQGVQIQAPSTNTASIWVGADNTVTNTNGIEIQPGMSETIGITDPSKLWVYAVASSQTFNYAWL